MSEQYAHGYQSIVNVFASRTAERDAAFFLPHLSSGMNLLDCGSGMGSITIGLAKRVNPGEVFGIDISESQAEQATQLARNEGVENVEFGQGDVYSLDFPSESFDAVFAHTLLEHLAKPEIAIEEIYRILKPNGVFGTRHGDMIVRFSPPDKILDDMVRVIHSRWRRNGGEPLFGPKQVPMLLSVGFRDPIMSTSALAMTGPEAEALFGGYIEDNSGDFVQQGLATTEDIKRWRQEHAVWSELPGAFVNLSVLWEAVVRKPT